MAEGPPSEVTGGAFVEALRRVNRATRGSVVLRRAGVSAFTTATALVRWRPPPRVLLNGPAKSGTHLLADAVGLLPAMSFSGRHFENHHFRDPGGDLDGVRLRRWLDRCRSGFFVTAHAPCEAGVRVVIEELGFRHVLLVRDPRDMVLSLAHYITTHQYLPRHAHFAAMADDKTRVLAVIDGYDHPDGHGLPPVSATLRDYLGWLQDPAVHVVRFEDLVGPRGGGDALRQRHAIGELASHLDRGLDTAGVDSLAEQAFATTGLTFRAGRIGGWRHAFDDEMTARFEARAGDLTRAFGYD